MTTRQRAIALLVLGVMSVYCLAFPAAAGDFTIVDQSPARPSWPWAPTAAGSSLAEIGGTLKLYVVEPTSRWVDHNNQPYHFGFIELALDSAVTIPDGSRTILSRTWDASASGFSNFTQGNIMVVAVLFEDEWHAGYSNPPTGNQFFAYYTMAAAAALAGASDSNNTSANSTHTIFLEEVSANYCTYCPTTNYWVNYVYNSGLYNFHMVTHVTDRNGKSGAYLQNYSLYAVPTCYYDGGDEVVLGGVSPSTPYTSKMLTAGQRAVENAGLMVKVDWLNSEGDLAINVILANGVAVDNAPEVAPPSGETHPIITQSYDYTTSGTDAEGDDLYYKFNWGDNSETDWLGPYASGDPCTASHSWAAAGPYDVTVQCRDAWYVETGWSAPLALQASCCTLRGDLNSDGSLKVSDLTALVNYLFKAGLAPACPDHGDINNDGGIKVSDLTYLVGFLFRGGAAPLPCF